MNDRRILEQLLIHYARGNQSEFARIIGCKQGVIAGWIRRDSIDAKRIKAALPLVDGNWLLTGKGNMLLDEDSAQSVNVKGDHNTTHVNSHNTTKSDEHGEKQHFDSDKDIQVLLTKIQYLETLLEEKERLINVLLPHSQSPI